MKFYVRDISISTGGVPVALVNKEDALKLDLHVGDRILIKKGKASAHAIVDIAKTERVVAVGEIGFFEEVMKSLKLKPYDKVDVELALKPNSVYLIKDKLNGNVLNYHQIDEIIKDVVNNKLTDVELAYFVSGCYTKGLNMEETVNLTKAIVNNGDQLNMNHAVIVDKHCAGGVPGNRTTMALVPIILASGLKMFKTSSRAITSPAGTADTMEVLAKVDMPVEELRAIARKIGGFIAWGGAMNLASADDKLIRIRHPLSLDPEGMLLASIMAKKYVVGSKYVLIDIPVGKDVKFKTKKDALRIKSKFIELGKKLGMHVDVVITDGSQPVGNGIGAALEARDVLKLLRNEPDAPQDLRKKVIFLASKIFDMAKKHIKDHQAKKMSSPRYAEHLIASGKAYEKMKEIIMAQKGNPNILPDQIELGNLTYNYCAHKSGKIIDIDNKVISQIGVTLGSPVEKGAGLFLKVKKGYSVKKGDVLFIAYSYNKDKMEFAKKMFEKAIKIK